MRLHTARQAPHKHHGVDQQGRALPIWNVRNYVMGVYQTISNLDVNYLIPKRIHSTDREVIETMIEDGQEVAVKSATVHVDHGSHAMQFLYVPSAKGDGAAVFADESLGRS